MNCTVHLFMIECYWCNVKEMRSFATTKHIGIQSLRHQTTSEIATKNRTCTKNEKNFREQTFSLNRYVIIFQRRDFPAIFFLHKSVQMICDVIAGAWGKKF